jgi:hypothetical protein
LDLSLPGLHGLDVLAEIKVFRVVQRERGGVIRGERVRVMKSPARRSRAGLGVHGVAGVLILSL